METKHPLLVEILHVFEYTAVDDDSHLEIPLGEYKEYKVIHFSHDNFYLSEGKGCCTEWWVNRRKLEEEEVSELLYLNDIYEANPACKTCEKRWNINECKVCKENSVNFDGTIVITDPCYILSHDDWRTAMSMENDINNLLRPFGFDTAIVSGTLCGDWSCETLVGTDVIGKFTADAGLVCVVYLDDIVKYNPDYNIPEHCRTIIKDFSGDVSAVMNNRQLSIKGKGNIDFYTRHKYE